MGACGFWSCVGISLLGAGIYGGLWHWVSWTSLGLQPLDSPLRSGGGVASSGLRLWGVFDYSLLSGPVAQDSLWGVWHGAEFFEAFLPASFICVVAFCVFCCCGFSIVSCGIRWQISIFLQGGGYFKTHFLDIP